MNTRKFQIFLTKGESKATEATFSWNGSSDKLDEILKDATITGKFANSGVVQDNSEVVLVVSKSDPISANNMETDPSGAGSFMIAVILIYGFSIIFLIASQVFQKRKAYYKDSDKNINNYLDNAAQLRDESKRESFKKLKWSLIPVLAQSPSARTLIAKSVKYTPYLVQYVPFTAVSTSTNVDCQAKSGIAEYKLENDQTRYAPRKDTMSPSTDSGGTFGVPSRITHSSCAVPAEKTPIPSRPHISKITDEDVNFAGKNIAQNRGSRNVSFADIRNKQHHQCDELSSLIEKETNV